MDDLRERCNVFFWEVDVAMVRVVPVVETPVVGMRAAVGSSGRGGGLRASSPSLLATEAAASLVEGSTTRGIIFTKVFTQRQRRSFMFLCTTCVLI